MTRSASTKQDIRTTNLGRVLKSWRMLKDLPMREAGQQIGLSASTLCRIETGFLPDFDTMMTILNWLSRKELGNG